MRKLEDKVAIITGAASGMGRATAIRFAGEGAAVVVADLNREGGESTVRQCKENGGNAIFVHTDVASEEAIANTVARAVKEFGKLNVIYNNAGIGGAVGPIEKITVENWNRSFNVLMLGVFLGIKHAVSEMRKAGGGSIISTASVAGLRGGPGLHAYCAAKAGVVNLTRSAAIELAPDKIRVNCICPGGINTPIIHRNIPGAEQMLEQQLAKMQPFPRAGHPDDIASAALFLASDDSEFITGQALVVDGGLTAGWSQDRSRENQNAAAALAAAGGFVGPSFEKPGA